MRGISMISQLGALVLMVGLAVAIYGVAAAVLGARFGRWEFVASAYRAVLWLFGLVTVAALLAGNRPDHLRFQYRLCRP